MAKVVLKGLTKKYGENTVVNNIDLEVPDGRLVAILGPSGCGKTTTLRMIAGFEVPNAGEIYFDEDSMTKVPANKRNIGMVFQSYALFPHMTVFENIAYGLEQRKLSKEEIRVKVEEAMKMVHLESYATRRPKQLSGGQQQRVALARALVIGPRVLLLDESLSALDKKLRVEMQAELRRIQEEAGVTTFFVTHDQEEAMTLSDYIVVMNEGIIVQMGTPYEVYENPRNMFVASFLGTANFFKAGEKLFAVRPEKVRLTPERQEDSRFKAKVRFITYSGNLTSFTLENVEALEAPALEAIFPDTEKPYFLSEKQTGSYSAGDSGPPVGDLVFISWDEASGIELEA